MKTHTTILLACLLAGCSVDLVRNSDDAFDRYDCLERCAADSCQSDSDQQLCGTQCVNHTEEKAASYSACAYNAEYNGGNCVDAQQCLEEFNITDTDRKRCELQCNDLNDGEGPELAVDSKTVCDNRCYDRPIWAVEDFLECVEINIPDGIATYQSCYDDHLMDR